MIGRSVVNLEIPSVWRDAQRLRSAAAKERGKVRSEAVRCIALLGVNLEAPRRPEFGQHRSFNAIETGRRSCGYLMIVSVAVNRGAD
jgi:hypothetical protein